MAAAAVQVAVEVAVDTEAVMGEAATAAIAPTESVLKPDEIIDLFTIFPLIIPITKNATAVKITEYKNALEVESVLNPDIYRKIKGSNGIIPITLKATNVVMAVSRGFL